MMPSTKIVSSGTPIFHHVAALFVYASLRTPGKLIDVKIAISTTAAAMPLPVNTFWLWLSFIHLFANEQCCPYRIIAMTSLGATVPARSHQNQPHEAPTAPPND